MLHANFRYPLLFAEGAATLTVHFELPEYSFTALCGPSGAGKTTVLRTLAGLVTPESGQISLNDQMWLDTEQRINYPPQQRSIGFVFQDYALFPNMTVRENLLFAARQRNDPFADELLSRLRLTAFAARKPQTLSGGQRQRVALARALVRRPTLLLLDEPLAALDARTAQQLREDLAQLHRELGTTTLLVSHNADDIRHLADRILFLEQGQLRDAPSALAPLPSVRVSGQVLTLEQVNGLVIITLQTESGQLRLPVRPDAVTGVQPGQELTLTGLYQLQ